MAGGMKPILIPSALAASLAAFAAAAQVLSDPTRPPTAAAAENKSEQSIADSTGLQSILISSGRKLAVINGQTIALGQKYGDATLVAIRETEVVLKTPGGTEVLKLYPQAEKKLSSARQAGKTSAYRALKPAGRP